jgi:ubiquinone/menaquinone biosynthesis C-methylase UbiE
MSIFIDKAKYYHSMPHRLGRGKKMLDIGCNDGRKLIQFRRRGWRIYGVDVNKHALNLAKKWIPDGKFYYGTLEQAFYPDNFFDCVRIDNVLEHIEEPVKMLLEVYRVLKSGGELYIYVPNGESFTVKYFKGCSINSWIPYHISLFTKKSLSFALNKAGFKIDNIKFLFCTPLSWFYQTIKIFIKGKMESNFNLNLPEKFVALLFIPLSRCLNILGIAEEIVVKARK